MLGGFGVGIKRKKKAAAWLPQSKVWDGRVEFGKKESGSMTAALQSGRRMTFSRFREGHPILWSENKKQIFDNSYNTA
ncbi:MAG: hypothetical protein N3D11_17490 [Candidatus Sumerlaeia bacterium]|nr:hypothetical protein [Candidatus Sumerlaeia bacterium]